MANEQLRSMLNNLINEKSTEATLDFHQYITEQVKSIVGLSEAQKSSGNFVLALVKTGTDKLIGYYVADDKPVTKKLEKALKFSTEAKAKSEAKINNAQWDLDGEHFVVKDIEKLDESAGPNRRLSEGEKNDVLKKLLDPKINWWEQIDDVKKAFKSKEISDDDVETWSKKIDNDQNVSSFGKFGAGVYLIPSKSEYFVDSRDGDSISNYLYLHITGGGTLISANGSDFDELEDFAKKNGPKGLSIIYAYNGGSSAVGEIAIIGCKPSEIKVLSKELSQHYTANDFDEDIANEEDGEVDNATTFASHYFGGLEKFMKDYGVSKKDALSFLDIEAPNVVSVLETSKGILMAIAEND